jgi:cupin fold WbuC family metalloprotein
MKNIYKKKTIIFLNTKLNNIDYKNIFNKLSYSSNGIKRICLHKSEKSKLHIMILQTKKGFKFPKHSHLDTNEFLFILKGKLELTIYNSHNIKKKVLFGNSKDMTLIKKGVPHSTNPLSDKCIYLEVKNGPYNRQKVKFYN